MLISSPDPVESQPRALHPAFVAALESIPAHLRVSSVVHELTSLLVEAAECAPGLEPALASRLGFLLGSLDTDGLRRWFLTGLRLYSSHPAHLASYLKLEDPLATQVMTAESDGHVLKDVRGILQHYAHGFTWHPLVIGVRRHRTLNALPLRSVISDGTLLLPDHYLALDGASAGNIYFAAVAHALAHLQYSPRHQAAGKKKPLLLAVLSLVEDARVERLAAARFPGWHALWSTFHSANGDNHELTFISLASRLARALHDPSYADPNHWVNKGRELFEAEAARDLSDPERFADIGKILGNDLGQMRVRFVSELYVVEPAYRDDNSFLWEFDHDAPPDTPPEEMLTRQSVQIELTDQQAEQAMRVSPMPTESGQRFEYPEWDHRESQLRDEWATVLDRPASVSGSSAAVRPQQDRTRATSMDTRSRTLDRAIRLRRQYEGESLDLNAVIDSRILWRAGAYPDPRIFQRPGKRRRHTSVLLLMDLSESTNDRIKGFTSILDIEKQAAHLLALSIDTTYDRLAIDGFNSDGRQKVHYFRVKGFDEPYGDQQRGLLMQLQGSMSTRMGAALRHAGARLARDMAEKRILLLVTDGEPSDIDVDDREYLVEDARHAVQALQARGIKVFCLTVDREGESYMKKIFGYRNYMIVDNALSLPTQLARAITRMAAN